MPFWRTDHLPTWRNSTSSSDTASWGQIYGRHRTNSSEKWMGILFVLYDVLCFYKLEIIKTFMFILLKVNFRNGRESCKFLTFSKAHMHVHFFLLVESFTSILEVINNLFSSWFYKKLHSLTIVLVSSVYLLNTTSKPCVSCNICYNKVDICLSFQWWDILSDQQTVDTESIQKQPCSRLDPSVFVCWMLCPIRQGTVQLKQI